MNKNNALVLLVLVSGFANAATWAERAAKAKQQVAGASSATKEALKSFAVAVQALKDDRMAHANITSELITNSTQNTEDIKALNKGLSNFSAVVDNN